MKSSELNTTENPPAISASSPRDNPCLGHDANAAAVAVLTDDGISYHNSRQRDQHRNPGIL